MTDLASDLSSMRLSDDGGDEAALLAALQQQEAQRKQLLEALERSSPASPTAASSPGATPMRTDAAVESSAPDDDLVPPHYTISSNPDVRDASVELLHCITALKVWHHILESVEDMRPDWEEMLASLWDFPESIVTTADVQLDRVDPVSEEERKAVNEEVAGFVEVQREAAVKTSTEEVRDRICKLARLESQVAIGNMLLDLGITPQPASEVETAAGEEELARAARLLAFHIRDDVTKRQQPLTTTPSKDDLQYVDINGRIRWDKVHLPPVRRPE